MKAVRRKSGFTLIELLVVISIMGLIAAIAVPAIKNFGRADATASASRQLLDDIGRARQLALSQRTPVYMVFVPSNFWNFPGYTALYNALPQTEKDKADRLFDKQLNSYALVALGSVGDQPGQHSPRYLSPWKTLPEGNYIASWKFGPRNLRVPGVIVTNHSSGHGFEIYGFSVTNSIPFPSDGAAPYATAQGFIDLPYIPFDYNGQLRNDDLNSVNRDEFIPLAHGTIAHARDPETRLPLPQPPEISENPIDSSTTNGFNLVHIDWLTGRARVERPQIQ